MILVNSHFFLNFDLEKELSSSVSDSVNSG